MYQRMQLCVSFFVALAIAPIGHHVCSAQLNSDHTAITERLNAAQVKFSKASQSFPVNRHVQTPTLISGKWNELAPVVFPPDPLLQTLPEAHRAEARLRLSSLSSAFNCNFSLGFDEHNRLVCVEFDHVPHYTNPVVDAMQESEVRYERFRDIQIMHPPRLFKTPYIDLQPSPFYPISVNWITGNAAGKWNPVREQFWLFPGIGLSHVVKVDLNSYLGNITRSNISTNYYLKGPQYSYISDRVVHRLILKSPDGRYVWLHELRSDRRSDKIGVENRVRRSYVMTSSFAWRMMLGEIENYQREVVSRRSAGISSRIDSLDLSTYSYERNLVSATEPRDTEATILRRYAGLILALLDEDSPPDQDLSALLGLIPSEIAQAAVIPVVSELDNKDRTRAFRLRCYDWLCQVKPQDKKSLFSLIGLLHRFRANPSATGIRVEVDAERARVAEMVKLITGQDWGEDANAWKKWLATRG